MLDSDGEGTEALAARSIEADSRLKEGVSDTSLAGLKRLNPGRIEHIHIWGDSGV